MQIHLEVLHKIAKRQTDKQRRLHNLLGGGNNYRILLVVCNNNSSILHCFRDATTFTVYLTACDLEKCLRFDTSVTITGHVVHFVIRTETYPS